MRFQKTRIGWITLLMIGFVLGFEQAYPQANPNTNTGLQGSVLTPSALLASGDRTWPAASSNLQMFKRAKRALPTMFFRLDLFWTESRTYIAPTLLICDDDDKPRIEFALQYLISNAFVSNTHPLTSQEIATGLKISLIDLNKRANDCDEKPEERVRNILKPRLAALIGYRSGNAGSTLFQTGLAASWLRPLDHSTPSKVAFGIMPHLSYQYVRISGSEHNVWGIGLTIQNRAPVVYKQTIREKQQVSLISRWSLQTGFEARAIDDQWSYALFIRWRPNVHYPETLQDYNHSLMNPEYGMALGALHSKTWFLGVNFSQGIRL
jgi:hypothetical protein